MNKTSKSSRFITVFLVMVIIVSITQLVSAYSCIGYKLYSAASYVPNQGYGQTSITHMGQAVQQWNTAAGTSIMSVSSSTHSNTSFPNRIDKKFYVYRVNTGNGNYVGLCAWTTLGMEYETYDLLSDADINLNMYFSWANSAQTNCYDVYSVFLHEAGHTVGLNDLYGSSDASKVMYGYASDNATKRSLTQDDKNGAAHIY